MKGVLGDSYKNRTPIMLLKIGCLFSLCVIVFNKFYLFCPAMAPPFPKSVTQARLEEHDRQFTNVLSLLSKSKETGQNSVQALYENIGELRFSQDAIESSNRDTRLLAERNRDGVADLDSTLRKSVKAYNDLKTGEFAIFPIQTFLPNIKKLTTPPPAVLDDEVDRIRTDHGAQLTSLASSVNDKERNISTTNNRIGDLLTDQQNLRSRCEDDLERMKGQMRQHRIEIDDVRRQAR